MSLMWLSNTNIKKLKRPKPNEKRGREPSPAKRENPCRLEPMPSFSPPSCCSCPGGALVVPNLGMSLPCQAPTIFLPQFVANPSPKPQASIADPFQRLCFCFGMGFAFMFVFHSGFRAMFVFRYGFRCLCLCFGVDFKLGF